MPKVAALGARGVGRMLDWHVTVWPTMHNRAPVEITVRSRYPDRPTRPGTKATRHAAGKLSSGLLLLIPMLALLAAGCRSAVPNTLATHDSSRWEKEIAAFEAADRTNLPPRDCIVFVGSSSIRLWTNVTTDFPNLAVINRGFGGSQLADSVWFADRIIIPYHPKQVVIYAGGNDINAGKAPELVYGDFVALVTKLHEALPGTRLAFISSAPNPRRWAQVEKVKRLNALAQAYCRKHKIDFIDVFPLMLGPDGQPKPDIYVADRLHMNSKGYAIWKAAVAPVLR